MRELQEGLGGWRVQLEHYVHVTLSVGSQGWRPTERWIPRAEAWEPNPSWRFSVMTSSSKGPGCNPCSHDSTSGRDKVWHMQKYLWYNTEHDKCRATTDQRRQDPCPRGASVAVKFKRREPNDHPNARKTEVWTSPTGSILLQNSFISLFMLTKDAYSAPAMCQAPRWVLEIQWGVKEAVISSSRGAWSLLEETDSNQVFV